MAKLVCKLCGGTSGAHFDGAHALCAARAKHGRPTPTLGDACACCNGSGCHPRSAVGPINPNQDAIDRWAPACVTCQGSGVMGMNEADQRAFPRKLHKHFAKGCT